MVFFFPFFVVWECEHWNRHLILKRIVEYVLLRHLSLSKENIVHIVDQLDFSLLHGVRGNELATEYFQILPILFIVLFSRNCSMLCNKKVIILLDPISFSGSLLEALEVLSKCLRLIQDIPLKVSSVQPLDPGTFS